MTVKWHADPRVMSGADVASRVRLGPVVSVWHLAQIGEDAEVGADCISSRRAYIGLEVPLGERCKPAWLDDGVFAASGWVMAADVPGIGAPVGRAGRAGVARTATDDGMFRCSQKGAEYVQAGGTPREEYS